MPGGIKVIWHHFSFEKLTILAAILASYRVILVIVGYCWLLLVIVGYCWLLLVIDGY